MIKDDSEKVNESEEVHAQEATMLNPEKHYLHRLIEKTEEDLVNTRVQCWIYQQEYLNPKHLGKTEAGERLAQYQKRVTALEENILVYYEYAKFKDYEDF